MVSVDTALFMLHVSPDDDDVVSADDDTVAMEVKDSEEGKDVLSEKAESVSPVSPMCSGWTVKTSSVRPPSESRDRVDFFFKKMSKFLSLRYL